MTRTAFARSAALAAATALAASAATPALARSKGPATITLTKAMEGRTDRLCMPKTTLGNKADKAMPETICQSRTDWEAQGVTFKVK